MSNPLTISTKIRFQRVRDGRKRLEKAPAKPPPRPPAPVPRSARLMALTIHFDRLIREGTVASYSEIARLTGVSPAWISTVMKLADLPVPEQERRILGTGFEMSKGTMRPRDGSLLSGPPPATRKRGSRSVPRPAGGPPAS